MRLVTLVGFTWAVVCAPGAAHAAASTTLRAAAPEPAVLDTTSLLRFGIPAQPVADALDEYARQAGVRVKLDVAATAGARSHAVSGTMTAAAALRQLLEGTGLSVRFADGGTALVTRTGADRAYALTPVTVVGAGGRGYAVRRSSTATKTDTPLRDTPQSVSVVSRDVIADQSMQGMADVVRYVPGVTMALGEGHRDAPTIRGNSSTADFFVDGVRDDAQYLRDLYNAERVEALKGSNAMIFGRGGGGGVINRVSKEAQWSPTRTLTAEGGSWDHARTTLDVGQGLGSTVAARFNGVYESSGGFRDRAALRRYGINPTVALALGAGTTLKAGYEYFDDNRRVDRGIPSYAGAPAPARITTFFGNPDINRSTVRANSATATLEHVTEGGLTIRSRARFADYDKFYQNSYPGAVTADGQQVALAAYNHRIGRRNLFDQTDLVYKTATGPVQHTLLLGAEAGRQQTEQLRNTGYYNNTATSYAVPFSTPTVTTPITFRQSATDADNGTLTTVAGVYVQDQLSLSRQWQLIGGLRADRFSIAYHNHRTDEKLDRRDALLSPRAGLVFKPLEAVSLYGSVSRSYLPSSGDQFTSLTVNTQALEPERFTNYEAGAKWEARPDFSLTAAVYRLDRTNTSAPDPNDATKVVQTGEQRTTGVELGASGNVTPRWQVLAGFASQRARIVSTTSAAQAGQTVALVPHQTLSLWNRYQLFPALGVGLGVVKQSEMFAAIDNTVRLPGFTRADGAVFLKLTPALSAQANVENVLNRRYYPTSQGNNNIMPGAPRTLRVTITAHP